MVMTRPMIRSIVVARAAAMVSHWARYPEYHWMFDSDSTQLDRIYTDCAEIVCEVVDEVLNDISAESPVHIDLAVGYIIHQVLDRLNLRRLKYGYFLTLPRAGIKEVRI